MTPPPIATASDQRAALRIPAARVPSIQGVRISPPNDLTSTLVNISTTGVLVECTAKPRPGSSVTVHFLGTFTPSAVRGRVARTIVASLGKDGLLRYMVGIAFDEPIQLEVPAPEPAVAEQPAEPAPRAPSRLQNRW